MRKLTTDWKELCEPLKRLFVLQCRVIGIKPGDVNLKDDTWYTKHTSTHKQQSEFDKKAAVILKKQFPFLDKNSLIKEVWWYKLHCYWPITPSKSVVKRIKNVVNKVANK